MDKRIGRVFISAAALLVALLPSAAQADNTACAGAIILTPDGSEITGSFTANPQQRWFKIVGKARRSYAAMMERITPTDAGTPITMVVPQLNVCGGINVTTNNISAYEPDGSAGGSVGRWARAMSADETLLARWDSATGTDYRVRVVETTLTSPLWTTFSNFETFYRFNNVTNGSISVTLWLLNDAGTVVASPTFAVPANSTSPTRNTGPTDLNLPDDTAGQAIITHNGPPGAIHVDGFSGNFSVSPPVVLPIKIEPARQQR
jgi:hypothetical protein